MEEVLKQQIKEVSKKFLKEIEDKEIFIISHHDTDGITSAAIMIKTLKKLDKKFSIKIIKGLEKSFIETLPKNKVLLFLDLASGSLNHLSQLKNKNIFIIDHHQITQEIPENISIVNSEILHKEKISGAGLTYLFCKELNKDNRSSAKLAALGMIGDLLEKEIDKLNNGILNDGEIKKRRGPLIYPSTRPLNRTLEFSSNPFIPGVTGNIKGVLELLRETGLIPKAGKCKSLIELNDNEMKKLVTAIMLRCPKTKSKEIIGDIFLIKLFNKLEDARELSAKINACSRLGESGTALQLCLEIPSAKKKAESIHVKYRQHIVSGLKFASETEKITGKNYILLNAKNQIKDTIIGTIATILSKSSLYEEGTIIIAMAYSNDKIKISARSVGNQGKNLREILAKIISQIGGEVGGHKFAAGALISKKDEEKFIELLKKKLEIEMVKV
jgi:RecJ-like exonuclease